MAVEKKQGFYWRAFVSFFMTFAAAMVAISGVVLYIAPPGRIANWSYWALGGLEKAQWQALHTIFAFLFVLMTIAHLYFNWRVIIGYLRTKIGQGIHRKWELATSSALVILIVVPTLTGTPPFSTVMTAGDRFKNSWATAATEPPAPHAETWTVEKFSDTMKVPVEQAAANLVKAGWTMTDASVTLLDLAKQRNVTPQAVYMAAMGEAKAPKRPLAEGGGYGQKTIGQLCEQAGLPVSVGMERLRTAGVDKASPDSNVRELALETGKTPIEIVRILEGQDTAQ
jgi:hypothetical protein